MEHNTYNSTRRFVSWERVLQEVDVPKSTLYDWINQGLFPRPVQLGPRRVAFCRDQLENWKSQRFSSSGENAK